MKPFNIKLSDEHRAKLESYRAHRGLRSEADAVRDLIDRYSPQGREAKAEAFVEKVEAQIEPGARPAGQRFSLQIGMSKPEPGSLLKKPKGSK